MAKEIEPPYKLANAPLPCFDIGQENGIIMFKIKGKWAEGRYEEIENPSENEDTSLFLKYLLIIFVYMV